MSEETPVRNPDLLLEARGIGFRFPDGTWAIRDIDLEVRDGEFLVVAGPNGSGKSVLMRHLNGLLRPTEGEVRYRGEPVGKDPLLVRSRVGLVFQDADSQFIGQTVEEDVAFGPENLNLPREEVTRRVHRSLSATGLSALASRPPYALSGGEKRRLAVAGVLAMEPEIVILDEPFANLDYPGVLQVLRQVLQLHEQGHAVIVITHELEKVLAHADRLVILAEGRKAADGPPVPLLPDLPRYALRRPGGIGIEAMTWLT